MNEKWEIYSKLKIINSSISCNRDRWTHDIKNGFLHFGSLKVTKKSVFLFFFSFFFKIYEKNNWRNFSSGTRGTMTCVTVWSKVRKIYKYLGFEIKMKEAQLKFITSFFQYLGRSRMVRVLFMLILVTCAWCAVKSGLLRKWFGEWASRSTRMGYFYRVLPWLCMKPMYIFMPLIGAVHLRGKRARGTKTISV